MPNTLKQNVDSVVAATSSISNAIVAKGGTVPVGAGLEEFADAIATIPSGGGGDEFMIPTSTIQIQSKSTSSTWNHKIWKGPAIYGFYGNCVWTDGENTYYSAEQGNWILNKSTSTWEEKEWNGLSEFNGDYIVTDGTDIYYFNNGQQYALDKSTSTWIEQSFGGLDYIDGGSTWSDGENIYYSDGSTQKILNKTTSMWEEKEWNGLTDFDGVFVWKDGSNIYYSAHGYHYVLNKSTSTWEEKEWHGLEWNITGNNVWTDGVDIYYSEEGYQYILNRSTSTWEEKEWHGTSDFYGCYVWSDGDNAYLSSGGEQYALCFNAEFITTIDKINTLADGVCIILTSAFDLNTVTCTLNVNSLGSKPIYFNSNSSQTPINFVKNASYTFVYDSTKILNGCWEIFNAQSKTVVADSASATSDYEVSSSPLSNPYINTVDNNSIITSSKRIMGSGGTTVIFYPSTQSIYISSPQVTTYTPEKLGFGYGTCSTQESTLKKTVSITNYSLTKSGFVSITFTNAVPANSTLNINSRGAKDIFYRGAKLVGGEIAAGDTATFVYDGTRYRLIANDRWGVPAT